MKKVLWCILLFFDFVVAIFFLFMFAAVIKEHDWAYALVYLVIIGLAILFYVFLRKKSPFREGADEEVDPDKEAFKAKVAESMKAGEQKGKEKAAERSKAYKAQKSEAVRQKDLKDDAKRAKDKATREKKEQARLEKVEKDKVKLAEEKEKAQAKRDKASAKRAKKQAKDNKD